MNYMEMLNWLKLLGNVDASNQARVNGFVGQNPNNGSVPWMSNGRVPAPASEQPMRFNGSPNPYVAPNAGVAQADPNAQMAPTMPVPQSQWRQNVANTWNGVRLGAPIKAKMAGAASNYGNDNVIQIDPNGSVPHYFQEQNALADTNRQLGAKKKPSAKSKYLPHDLAMYLPHDLAMYLPHDLAMYLPYDLAINPSEPRVAAQLTGAEYKAALNEALAKQKSREPNYDMGDGARIALGSRSSGGVDKNGKRLTAAELHRQNLEMMGMGNPTETFGYNPSEKGKIDAARAARMAAKNQEDIIAATGEAQAGVQAAAADTKSLEDARKQANALARQYNQGTIRSEQMRESLQNDMVRGAFMTHQKQVLKDSGKWEEMAQHGAAFDKIISENVDPKIRTIAAQVKAGNPDALRWYNTMQALYLSDYNSGKFKDKAYGLHEFLKKHMAEINTPK